MQISGMPLEPGVQFYGNHRQYGHFCCAYCDASVHYNEGSPSTAGSSFSGRAAHFATNPEEKHKDCLWDFRDPSQSIQDIDPSKGYRLHFNGLKYSELFNPVSGVYGRGPGGRLEILDPDLKDRERLVIKSASDVMRLLEKGNFERVKDSVAIFRNQKYKWEDFFVRYGNHPARFFSLLDRSQNALREEPPFCLMEIRTDKAYPIYLRKTKKVPSTPILMAERDHRGLPQEIQPVLDLRQTSDMRAKVAFEGAGRSFFVLGTVRHNRFEGDRKTIHYLNMRIESVEQIFEGRIEDVYRKGLTRKSAIQPSPSIVS